MKTFKTSAILTAVAALALASCGHGDQSSRDISFSRDLAAEVYTLDGTAASYDTDSDLTVAMQVDVLMPEAIYANDLSALQDSIRSKAFGRPEALKAVPDYFSNTIHQFGDSVSRVNLDADRRQALLSSQPDLQAYDGSAQVTVNVASMSPRLFSFVVTGSSYMPRAAHGMYSESYVNYDAEQNKVLTLADIFTPAGLEALPALIAARATRNVASLGQTNITSLPADGDFCLSSDGNIVFVYQPYEVASYSQGVIKVGFQPYELNDYLTTYAKVLFLNE